MLRTAFFATVLFLSVGVSTSHAKIWRLNNTSGTNADFNTLQNAHNGANSGDTIHVEGSSVSYGTLTCTKKLILIGPGYFLGENPNSQASLTTAKVGTITLNYGSAGTVIMGLDFEGNGINVYCNDVFIRRNKFSAYSNGSYEKTIGFVRTYYLSNATSTPVSNIMISQNYGLLVNINNASSGIVISNNYLTYSSDWGDATSGVYCLTMNSYASALIQNNIIRRGIFEAYNSNVSNNIIFVGSYSGGFNQAMNNMGNTGQFGTANGNQSNVTMSTVFVASGSPDGYWKLKAGSPALGAGFGSTAEKPVDCGLFGGLAPYVLAGLPPIPAIYFFENQPVGSNADPVDVSVKVKSVTN